MRRSLGDRPHAALPSAIPSLPWISYRASAARIPIGAIEPAWPSLDPPAQPHSHESGRIPFGRESGRILLTRHKPVGANARAAEHYDRKADGYVGDESTIIRALPRRAPLRVNPLGATTPLLSTNIRSSAGFFHSLSRTFVWFFAAMRFFVPWWWDQILRRGSPERRARRFYLMFEQMGGTLLKVGQQLAVRVDLLPYVYCRELSKLLDSVKPFSSEEAVAIIERSTGKPLAETFTVFDPKPIGAASIACVYQAVIKTGEKVAIKVKRPGIQRTFAADCRALRWLLNILEGLTVIRPGLLRNFIADFEKSSSEELDFRREVRFQELFRRNAKDKKLTSHRFFTAPRVHFDLCGDDIIVQDYSSGLSLSEVLAAVETNDPIGLERMAKMNIDPKVVARRFMWIGNWGNLENFFFHADPHPANILIKENSEFVVIDFGACGTLNSVKRRAYLELQESQARRDVYGMVQSSIKLLEPIPPIDLHAFEKELEGLYLQSLSAILSKHSRWYERTTATLWVAFLGLCRKYQVPVNLDTVQMFRVSMLGDTIALRLDSTIDPYEHYRRFARDTAKNTKKRMLRGIRRRTKRRRLLPEDFAALDRFAELGSRAASKLARFLDKPSFSFNYMVEKSVFTIVTLVYVAAAIVALAGGVAIIIAIVHIARREPFTLEQPFREALWNPATALLALVAFLIGMRRILFRLSDRDVDHA